MERWLPIPTFPDYLVSDFGEVRHKDRTKNLSHLVNAGGNTYVSMWRDGKAYNRSLALLVAKAYLDPPIFETFDTPIHLDGDRGNNCYTNLMWRPLWFARKYLEQFSNNQRGFRVPVEIVETGEQFDSSWPAALKYGLLDRHILIASFENKPAWPTEYTFRAINTPYRYV